MVRSDIQTLETELLNSISHFLRNDTAESLHHGELLKRIYNIDSRAFLCGGAVRDIFLSKKNKKNIIPRDLDIVLGFERPDKVANLFSDCVKRWNCYGGVEIKHKYWSLDVWSLEKTWAFEQGLVKGASFKDFPNTTFLDIEAIVVQLYSKPGMKREIYSKGFFEAILTNTININLEPNPNPKSCIVRALHVANKYAFNIGQRLAKYIIDTARKTELEELTEILRSRYLPHATTDMFNLWIKGISEQLKLSQNLSVQLPASRYTQLYFGNASFSAMPQRKKIGVFKMFGKLFH